LRTLAATPESSASAPIATCASKLGAAYVVHAAQREGVSLASSQLPPEPQSPVHASAPAVLASVLMLPPLAPEMPPVALAPALLPAPAPPLFVLAPPAPLVPALSPPAPPVAPVLFMPGLELHASASTSITAVIPSPLRMR
jgi:hypothetical protein